MTPRQLDPAAVQRRLAEIDRLLGWLAEVGEPTARDLLDDWRTRLVVERLLAQLVELAVAVNLHLVSALGGVPPEDYRGSFTALGEVGVIEAELAAELAPAAGLRNVLTHDYLDIDLEVVAGAVTTARQQLRDYVDQVARWLDAQPGN